MKLLADLHHADLFESHQLVFADRFGFEVLAPYGMDWFDRRFWDFERHYSGDLVARQYLAGIWGDHRPDANGIVRLPDTRHPGRTITGITLDAALETRWDLVLSSVPDNANGFRSLAQKTGARWGIHIGNQWGDEAWSQRPDFAIVTTTSPTPGGIPTAVVHQEFSLSTFRYEPPTGFGPVRSFVNCFQEHPDYPQFQSLARQAPEFTWEVYGAPGTGPVDEFTKGDIHGIEKLADAMRAASVIWHAKHWSDGFGHVIHNAFAVGRPVFGFQRYYQDKLAGPLWIEGETSFDTESKSLTDIYDLIRRFRDDPDEHRRMAENAARRFREVVDFDEDADKIARMLGISQAVAA